MPKFLKCRIRGSVTLVMIGVLIVLLLMFTSFLRMTTSRKHTTKKIGSVLLARELSASLATLASHYIKKVILLSTDDDEGRCSLKSDLSVPFKELKDHTYDLSYIRSKFDTITDSNQKGLWSQLIEHSGLNIPNPDSDIKVQCILNKADFTQIGGIYSSYPREKKGVLKIQIDIPCILPGQKTALTESYEYFAAITVAANIVPVLSRFTLYVHDALAGGSQERFNKLELGINGSLTNTSEDRAWILNNGDAGKKLYRELIESSNVGLVYLGADSPLHLGLSRGSTGSEFGEEFMFFKNSNEAAGYWKTMKLTGDNEGIMSAYLGLCYDISGDNADWHSQMGAMYGEVSRRASVLKLYGTDTKVSPTLVLGNVQGRFMAVNMYKKPPDTINFLKYYDSDNQYKNALAIEDSNYTIVPGSEGYAALSSFGFTFLEKNQSPPSPDEYKKNYASCVLDAPYNMGYLYYLTSNNKPFPVGNGVDSGEKLVEYATYDPGSPDINLLTNMPDPYGSIHNTSNLTDIDTLTNSDKILTGADSASRYIHYIDISDYSDEETKALFKDNKLFKEQGWMRRNKLDLNGWLVINSRRTIPLESMKLVSHGGIIVTNGNIEVGGNITSENSAHMTLMAQNGYITVDASVGSLNASLYALGSSNGTVKFAKNLNSAITINGNIAMRKFGSSDDMKRELKLNYNPSLTALPTTNSFTPGDNELSELPMLMFGYSDDPRLIE